MPNIIKPDDFMHLRTVVLNRRRIITIDGKDVSAKGTKIGDLVRYHGKVYYLTYRTQEHFMRKWQAFGINTGIIDWLLQEEKNLKVQLGNDFVLFIIFHYDGTREKRYYVADPMSIEDYNLKAEFTKDTGAYLETYSSQYFYPIKKMAILGYDASDADIVEHKENVSKWDKFR